MRSQTSYLPCPAPVQGIYTRGVLLCFLNPTPFLLFPSSGCQVMIGGSCMLMMCEARRLEVALDEVELLLLVVVGELGLVAESRALAGCGSRDGSDCGACGCALFAAGTVLAMGWATWLAVPAGTAEAGLATGAAATGAAATGAAATGAEATGAAATGAAATGAAAAGAAAAGAAAAGAAAAAAAI
jgi:hypothetical protein